jgi:hypothetical protein
LKKMSVQTISLKKPSKTYLKNTKRRVRNRDVKTISGMPLV